MGKYLRKSKIEKESIALMDVSSSPSPLGVLTRAKSLALQKHSSPSKHHTADSVSSSSYLQLRSRRLQKNPPIVLIRSTKRRKQLKKADPCGLNPNPNPQNFNESKSDSVAESSVCGKEKMGLILPKESNDEINKDPTFETSSGENFFQLQQQNTERTTRESTPCSLMIKKPEINTSPPGSSSKLNNCISESNQREEESLSAGSYYHRRRLPSTPEMDEFFSGAEEEQQRQFIEKYNFDPVNEKPLPGRFEWTKVDD